MRRPGLVLCAAIALTFGACGGRKVPEFGRADADTIKKVTQDFVAAYNAKDAAKVVTFLSGSAVLMPPNSSTLRGQDSIKGYYQARFAEGATDLSLDPRDVSGSGPLAYASGSYSVRTGDRRDRGKYLWILRNMAGTWRAEYQVWSSDLPPSAGSSTSGS